MKKTIDILYLLISLFMIQNVASQVIEPVGLVAEKNGGTIYVSWINNYQGAGSVVLEKSIDGGTYTEVGSFNTSTFNYQDTDFSICAEICYRVRSINNSAVESPYSKAFCMTAFEDNLGESWSGVIDGAAVTGILYGIAASPNMIVAVGQGGMIHTSPDGQTWTSRTSGTSDDLEYVIWENDKFTVVGHDGTILESTDGINWTSVNSGTGRDLMSVIWNGELYVAVGGDNGSGVFGKNTVILYSYDGVNWTNTNTNGATHLRDVAWNGTQFVAAGKTGIVFTSPDGINWTSQTSGTVNDFNDVSWVIDKFIALSGDESSQINTDPNGLITDDIIMSSVDGVNWVEETPVVDIWHYAGFWTGYRHLISGNRQNSGNYTMVTTTDGDNFNLFEHLKFGVHLRELIYTGDQILVVGNAGGNARIYRSALICTNPTISCPNDVDVSCYTGFHDEFVTFAEFTTAGGSASDTDGSIVDGTFRLESSNITSLSCPFTVERTYYIEDNSGKSNTCTYTLSTNDVDAPILSCQDSIYHLLAANEDSVDLVILDPTVTENCGLETFTNDYTGTGSASAYYQPGFTNVVWTAVDSCGNSDQCVTVVEVERPGAPTIDCPDTTVADCIGNIPSEFLNFNEFEMAGGSASDNLNFTLVSEAVNSLGPCPLIYERVYSVENGSGVSSNCTHYIKAEDKQAPVLVYCQSDTSVFQNVGSDSAQVTLNLPVFTDNCGIESLINNYNNTADASDKYPLGSTVVEYTALDSCSNQNATCSFTVTVNALAAPSIVCPDTTVIECVLDTATQYLSVSSFIMDGGVVSDGAGLDSSSFMLNNQIVGASGCLQFITRSYEIENVNQVTAICTHVIRIEDKTPPTAIAPTPEWVCNIQPVDLNDITNLSDNCDLNPQLSYLLDTTEATRFSCAEKIIRVYGMIDACGNYDTITQIFLKGDTIKPVFDCPANIALDQDTDRDSAMVSMPLPTNLSDNCSIFEFPINNYNNTTNGSGDYPLGVTTLTWTVSDSCGNVGECQTLVTVNSLNGPSLTCPDTIYGACELDTLRAYTWGEFIDNGGRVDTQTSLDFDSFTFSSSRSSNSICEFEYIRTYQLSDVLGENGSCSHVFVIKDTIAPDIQNLWPIEFQSALGVQPPDLTQFDAEVDGCGGSVTAGFVREQSDSGICPEIITRYYLVSDLCLNEDTVTQEVRITGTDMMVDISGNTGFCLGDSVLLTASVTNGTPDSVWWDTGETGLNIHYDQAGWVKVWASTNGCSVSDSQLVDLQLPQPPLYSLDPCIDTIVNINFGETDLMYQWSTDNNEILSSSDSAATFKIPTNDSSRIGIASVTMAGCVSDTTWYGLIGHTYSFNAIQTGSCVPVFINPLGTSSSISDEITYYLIDDQTSEVVDTSIGSAFEVESGGRYRIQMQVDNNISGCDYTTDFPEIFSVSDYPEAIFETNVIDFNQLSIRVTNQSGNADSYALNLGDGNTIGLSLGEVIEHVYPAIGVYEISLIATESSCADTMVQSIELLGLTEIIPNVFHPFGNVSENTNFNPLEELEQPLVVPESYKLMIYDRWGKDVFKSTNMSEAWDGLNNNQKAAMGNYVWHLVYKRLNGEQVNKHGSVLLIR